MKIDLRWISKRSSNLGGYLHRFEQQLAFLEMRPVRHIKSFISIASRLFHVNDASIAIKHKSQLP